MSKKKAQAKSSQIIKAGIATILIMIALAYLAFFGETAVLPLNPQQNGDEKPNSTTPSPVNTPQPSPNPLSSVDITYNVLTKTSVGWNLPSGDIQYVQPDPGNVFLVVNMTIKNNGYEIFSINPYYFDAVADGVKYGFDNRTWSVGNWDLIDVLNGETFSGTLIFQIPATTESIIVDYIREWHDYNVIWTKT